jgi:hypothetical protein
MNDTIYKTNEIIFKILRLIMLDNTPAIIAPSVIKIIPKMALLFFSCLFPKSLFKTKMKKIRVLLITKYLINNKRT